MTDTNKTGGADAMSPAEVLQDLDLEIAIYERDSVSSHRIRRLAVLKKRRAAVDALIAREAAQANLAGKRNADLYGIYVELQRVAPWSESNDMDISDEIMCGVGLMAQDRDALTKRIAELEVELSGILGDGLGGIMAEALHIRRAAERGDMATVATSTSRLIDRCKSARAKTLGAQSEKTE